MEQKIKQNRHICRNCGKSRREEYMVLVVDVYPRRWECGDCEEENRGKHTKELPKPTVKAAFTQEREIKFRAWDTYNERMIEDPEKFIPTGPHHYTDDPRFNSPFQYYETWQDIEDGVHRPCYIMQFIGLQDRNGKDIYEGDIIKSPSGYLRKIIWDSSRACFSAVDSEDKDGRTGVVAYRVEVIGNIHEHPHLLTAPQNDK